MSLDENSAADNEESRRPLVAQAVKLHFVIAHDLPELGDVKGSQPRTTANQYAAGRFACNDLSTIS